MPLRIKLFKIQKNPYAGGEDILLHKEGHMTIEKLKSLRLS